MARPIARPAVRREIPVWLFLLSRLVRFRILPFKLLIGFDVFISYARLGGTPYAEALAVKLGEQAVRPRIDQQGSDPGIKTPFSLRLAIVFSKVLVVVNSPQAAHNDNVADEISTFVTWSGGGVVPVELGCAMEEADWWHLIRNMARVVEESHSIATGSPRSEQFDGSKP